jgi:hypothetical protein
MIRSGSLTMSDFGSTIAALSFLVTLVLLILNLKVSGAMSELKTDLQEVRTEFSSELSAAKQSFQTELKSVELSVEKLRGDLYQEHAKLYGQVMDKSNTQYMNRELSLEMHTANMKRFEDIGKRIDDLTTRVGDIS